MVGALAAGGVDGVEDRQQALDEAALRPGDLVGQPFLGQLAEVVEVGCGAPVGVEELVAFGDEGVDHLRRELVTSTEWASSVHHVRFGHRSADAVSWGTVSGTTVSSGTGTFGGG